MYKFTFIDLFAGIGGFRIGLESIGGKCVFSSEIDSNACEIYKANFGEDPFCDVTKLEVTQLPDFDLLCAGFPCQAFSICGKQKGFYDETRGTLFFDICRILEYKKPKAFILENVANLEKHDNGRTFSIMLESLMSLGYSVSYKVLNAKNFGVPQNRERVIIIGNIQAGQFDFDKLKTCAVESMKPYLDQSGNFEYLDEGTYTIIDNYKKQSKSGLIFIGYRNKKIRVNGVRPGTKHLSRVHKQPNRIYSAEGIHPTIASQESSGRYWIYINNRVRKLTINECFKFMGFPADFKLVGPLSKMYNRIGNSICVPMVKAIAEEVYNQILKEEIIMPENDVMQFLENIYKQARDLTSFQEATKNLTSQQKQWVEEIYRHEETFKGVYTVLVTSLVYKYLHPEQDIRYHQANMENGYSGRSFDTKYITPFLKSKRFYGAMKESGWLTRSLEQNLPYTLEYPGKIQSKKVKEAFLNLIDVVEKKQISPVAILVALFKGSLEEKSKKAIKIINPIEIESDFSISQIISNLRDHFYFKYKSRGASILPVIAIYSIYECITQELSRFESKTLDKLASHTSCDRSSGAAGDIVVRDKNNQLYEVVEIKFDIPINLMMIDDAYKKIASTQIQRYYILSTADIPLDDKQSLQDLIAEIRKEHGCQVIINGIFPTLKYYLRLLRDTDKFIDKYVNNLSMNREINFEHKIAWNKIVGK